jgi:hypothetical protein
MSCQRSGTCANEQEISPCLGGNVYKTALFFVVVFSFAAMMIGPRQCYVYTQSLFGNSSDSCVKCSIKPAEVVGINEFSHDTTLTNSFMNPSKKFLSEWHLQHVDKGGFSFDACAPMGGLIVYLVDKPDNDSQQRGYAIVLDNNRDPPESFVSPIPGFPSKHPKSRVNKGFKLNSDERGCIRYWVVYDKGTVLVGEGEQPSSKATESNSKLITCMQNDYNAPKNLYYFGFGILNKNEEGITIKNIRTFAAPDSGCQWSAMVPQQCSSLTPL